MCLTDTHCQPVTCDGSHDMMCGQCGTIRYGVTWMGRGYRCNCHRDGGPSVGDWCRCRQLLQPRSKESGLEVSVVSGRAVAHVVPRHQQRWRGTDLPVMWSVVVGARAQHGVWLYVAATSQDDPDLMLQTLTTRLAQKLRDVAPCSTWAW